MVTFPNCKINLGLNVLQKRKDGYHDIKTVFYPIPIYDALEIISSPNQTTEFHNTGIQTGSAESNLCLKAFHLLKKNFSGLPEVSMHLHKQIPLGAGLGGGSSDATAALLLLKKKYQLDIPEQDLFEYASQLGSDCPFFLLNKPCFASGRGEILEPVSLSLQEYKILIVNPGIKINTGEIFQKIAPALPSKSIREIIQQPINTWKKDLVNDFEKIVFPGNPQVQQIKEDMYDHGALYAAMTGTGSTLYGIFDKKDNISYPVNNGYFHQWVSLS